MSGTFTTDTYILTQLRSMTDCGTATYTINGTSYWSDLQLQAVLDKYRHDVYESQLHPVDEYTSGTLSTTKYYIGNSFIESGTNFVLKDSSYNVVSTGFDVDYQLGLVTFTSDTEGLHYYATYRFYDILRAAADIWAQKAAHYAGMFTFKAGNNSVNKGDLMKQAMMMADLYRQQAGARSIDLERTDTT